LKVVDATLEVHPELSVGGFGAGSTGMMEARNSVVTVGGPVYVGRSNGTTGVLEIKDSLVKAAGDVALGYMPLTTGRLAIEGGTLELKSSLMLIGRKGTGTLELKRCNLIAYGLNLCDAGAFGRMVIKDGATVSLERDVRMIRTGGLDGELVMDGGVVNVSEMTNVNHAGGVGTRADFTLNGGTWKTGIDLSVGKTSNGGDAFLTINGGTMVVGNEVGIGLPGSGRSRIFLNSGLLQCEALAFKEPSADSLIVYRGGEIRVKSSAASEAAIQALITAGKIDAPADYQITTMGEYTVLRRSGMQTDPPGRVNADSFLSTPAGPGFGPAKEVPVE
jgi:hypothetical protein